MSNPWQEYEEWRAKYIDVEPAQLSEMDMKRELSECLDEYAKNKRALFMDGFADYVVRKGFGAVTPNKINGKPESWQMCGRRLWGERPFNDAMARAIARSRGGKTNTRTSRGSS